MSLSINLTITNLALFGVIAFALRKLFKFYQKWRFEQVLEKFNELPRDKVVLHVVPRCKTLPSISPFALKLETYLRMAKIPYELETTSPFGPQGKTPWITYNGSHFGDSHLIIEFLNKKFSVNLNKKASSEQIAAARACRVVLEDHFLWGLLYYRFVENISALPQLLKLPAIFPFVAPLQSYRIKKRLDGQGIGKHTPTQIYQMTEEDLRTVSGILGTKKFFGGDEPCEDDCAIFGSVAQAIWGLPGSSFERLIINGELSNLKQYGERMKHLYWQDWDSCVDKS